MLQLRKTFIKQLILELRVLNNQIKVNYVHKVNLSKAPFFSEIYSFPWEVSVTLCEEDSLEAMKNLFITLLLTPYTSLIFFEIEVFHC